MAPAMGETLRLASFDTELSRKGPGLLLRDILSGEDAQVEAVIGVIAARNPDILLLLDIDYDLGGHTLAALAEALAARGVLYPYRFSLRPNAGMATGLDMDGNGRLGEARDAQGYGRFNGDGGMALLSRLPIDAEAARDFSPFLWADLPGAAPPELGGVVFPSPQAFRVQRLASVGFWDVPVTLPDGRALHLLAFDATPPVFDGPEDRNGRRNRDELRFWQVLLDGALPFAPPEAPFVLMGDANLDPEDGEGWHEAIDALRTHPLLQDPAPRSAGAIAAANPQQRGDAALDTADWSDPVPGNLRVDYVLPSADIAISGAGVFWPAPDDPLHEMALTASRHRLVWVDLEF